MRVVDLTCHAAAAAGETRCMATPALTVLRHGAGELWIDERRVMADPSQTVLLNAGTSLRMVRHHGCRGEACAVTVRFDRTLVREIAEELDLAISAERPFPSPVLPVFPGLSSMLYALLAITGDTAGPGASDPRPAISWIRRILAAALRGLGLRRNAASKLPKEVHDTARRARKALVLRANESVSLSTIASELGLSQFYLCRLFKAEIGWTTQQYLHRVRIAEALYRLADGGEDLSGLAFDLGFSSHSHFTNVFRRLVGVPPSRLRDLLLEASPTGAPTPVAAPHS